MLEGNNLTATLFVFSPGTRYDVIAYDVINVAMTVSVYKRNDVCRSLSYY